MHVKVDRPAARRFIWLAVVFAAVLALLASVFAGDDGKDDGRPAAVETASDAAKGKLGPGRFASSSR